MKKYGKTLLALLLAIMMLLSLAACGEKAPSSTESSNVSDNTTSESKTTTTQEAATTTKPAGSKQFATIEEYVNSPVVQKSFEALKESFSSMPMTMTMEGKDNKLVYTYTYKQDIDKAAAKPALEKALEQQAATFENVVKQLRLLVDEENPVVRVVYLTKEGEEIYSCEFKAE